MTGACPYKYEMRLWPSTRTSLLADIKLVDMARITLPLFLITIAGSHHFVNAGQQNLIEAVGYIIIISTVLYSAIRKRTCSTKDWLFSLFILLLLMPGFIFEGLLPYRKASFLLSAVVLICVSILSKGQLFKRSDIELAVCGIALGVLASSVYSVSDGGALGVIGGFDGGVLYKNYFAGDMLCILIGAACVIAYQGRWTIGVLCVACVSLAMILVSGSKGAVLLTAAFIASILLGSFYSRNSRNERTLIILLALMISILLVLLFLDWMSDVETYQYRVRGLQNYLNFVNGDTKHILIGNSELLYNGQQGYAYRFRELTGWNGSIEFAWLNVLVKHGLLGIVVYMAIFVRLFVLAGKCNSTSKRMIVAILVTLLLSSFVESYMETMHSVVGPFCFMLANGLITPSKGDTSESAAMGA